MAIAALSFLGVSLLLLGFGWAVSVFLLRERRWFGVLPFAITIGFGGYTFFLNLISYVIPFRTAVWVVLVALGGAGLCFFILRPRDGKLLSGGFSTFQQRLLIASTLVITVFSGVVAIRTLSDDLWLMHLPLASTIAQGNAPVMDPTEPAYPMPYHYSPDLLTGAMNKVTGIPLWLGYDLQSILFTIAAFLGAFLLVLEFLPGFASAFLGAFLFLYGSGLPWLAGFKGVVTLWQTYVLHIPHASPWKFLADMLTTQFDSSIAITSLSHSVAMGIPVMLLVLFLVFRAMKKDEVHWLRLAIISGIAFGFLALTLETHFALIAAGLGITFVGTLIWKGVGSRLTRAEFIRVFAVLLIVFGIGEILALTQGGILSNTGGDGHAQFEIIKNFWNSDISDKNVLPFRWTFFKDFGLPLILFFPALYFFRRDRRIIAIGVVALLAFLIPLFIHYADRPREMERLFGIATPLFAFVVGMWLGEIWRIKPSTLLRSAIVLLVGGIVVTPVLFQLIYSVFPVGSIGKFGSPFFAVPEKSSSLDAEAYTWVREHTTMQDYFFPVSDVFIRETARFTPGYYLVGWGHEDTITAYRKAESCDLSGFQDLSIKYLYISEKTAPGFEDACISRLNASTVYEAREGGKYRKIYQLP